MLGRASHVIFEVLIAIVVIAALAAGAAMWRLSQGPVSLESAKPYLERALSSSDGSLKFELDSTVFRWAGWRRSLDIRGVGARMVGPGGRVIASVPEISVSFSLVALLRGVFAPTRVELINPTVRLTRTKSGKFQFGFGQQTETTGDFLPDVLKAIMSEPDADSPGGLLKQVSVVGARLTVMDEITGVSWRAPTAEFELGPSDQGLEAAFQLEIQFGPGGETNPVFVGTARFTPGDAVVRFDVAFQDLNPVLISGAFPRAADLRAFDLPLQGRARFDLDVRRSIRVADFDVSSGPGRIDLPRILDRPVSVDGFEARGRLDMERGKLRLEHSAIQTAGGEILFNATTDSAGGITAVRGDVKLAGLGISAVQRLWPNGMSPNGRAWVRQNLQGGNAEGQASFLLRVPHNDAEPVRIDRLAATMEVFRTSVHYFRPLPPVAKADATVVFGVDRIDIAVHRGEMNGLAVRDGKISMTGLDKDVSWLDFSTVLSGPLRNALEVLDHPRMRLIRGRGLHTASVSGNSATRMNIRLPMSKDLKLSDIEVKAASNLKDVHIVDAVSGVDLTGGQLDLRLDTKNMSLSGEITLAGTRSRLNWYENFQRRAEFLRRYELKGDIDQKTLEALRPDLGVELGGALPASVIMTEHRGGRADLKVRLGLKKSAVAIPALGWRKPAGRPGGVVLDMEFRHGKPVSVRQFHVRSELFTVSATAKLASDGKTLAWVDMSEFVVGDKTEISAKARRLPRGELQVRIQGPRFNAVPLVQAFDSSSKMGGVLPPMTIKANVRRVWVRPRVALNYVDATLRYSGRAWENVFIVSELSKARRFAIGYIERGGQAKVTMEASDAGATLKTFGILNDVEGGVLNVSAVQESPGVGGLWRGRVSVKNFRVRKAPEFARLLSLASLAGIADVMAGPGLTFNRLVLPFSLGKGRLDVVEARAIGSAIGITASGNIGLADERIDLKGTIIPAYTINSLLGNIPIIGAIFTGGKGKGIFAATYAIKGPLEHPKVTVNPLAALAPGFLRGLLQGLIDGGAPSGELPEPLPNE